jgi:hypothetical protein
MTTNASQVASRDTDLVLGAILSSLEVLKRQHLLAVAQRVRAQGLSNLPGRLEQRNTSELRALVDDLARQFHKSKPESLEHLGDIVSMVQVESLEKSRG